MGCPLPASAGRMPSFAFALLDAHLVYFLVERPVGAGRGTRWRSGHQRIVGPFTVAELPSELRMD